MYLWMLPLHLFLSRHIFQVDVCCYSICIIIYHNISNFQTKEIWIELLSLYSICYFWNVHTLCTDFLPCLCQMFYTKFNIQFFEHPAKKPIKLYSQSCGFSWTGNLYLYKAYWKYFHLLQSYSIGCSLVNPNLKDPIVIQICLIARSALTGC